MQAVSRVRIEQLDNAAMLAISRRRHQTLTALFRVLTWTGHGRAWAIAVVTLVIDHHYNVVRLPGRELALRAAFAAGIAWVIVTALKNIVRRRRPFQVIENFARLTPSPNDDSFPSGHAASAFAFLTAMTPLGPAVTTPIAIWSVLVAFSRYYLGVHFPSDILAGILIGIVCGTGVSVLS